MKRRSGEGQAALGRKAGPMRHRLEPRGGSTDDQEEILMDHECTKCFYAINPRDLVEWMGMTYHRRCAPQGRRPK